MNIMVKHTVSTVQGSGKPRLTGSAADYVTDRSPVGTLLTVTGVESVTINFADGSTETWTREV